MTSQEEKIADAFMSSSPPPKYFTPLRLLQQPKDMVTFQQSQAYYDITSYIFDVNNHLMTCAKPKAHVANPFIDRIIAMLKKLQSFLEEVPPHEQSQRFGNKAFRDWLALVVVESVAFHEEVVSAELKEEGAVKELSHYLNQSFGNSSRIDYGTGHELAFITWLAALTKVGMLTPDDMHAVGERVLEGYLELMRAVQSTYWLEPAGSKGVWGLDDYQFLPFLWGAAQLANPNNLTADGVAPVGIADEKVINEQRSTNLLFSAVAFVNKMKRGPFFEHSPMLHSISQLPHWKKINQGLTKMYFGEVLGKFPVVQHCLFGGILPFTPSTSASSLSGATERQALSGQGAVLPQDVNQSPHHGGPSATHVPTIRSRMDTGNTADQLGVDHIGVANLSMKKGLQCSSQSAAMFNNKK